MTEKIIKTLRKLAPYAWEITDEQTTGREFYFIRRRLDQCRAKDVRHVTVKVYMPAGEGKIGSAAGEIFVTATGAETEETLRALCRQATYAPNRAYTLNKPRAEHKLPRKLAHTDPDALAEEFIKVFASLPETATEDLNSYEIFANAVTRRFINSEGIDVTDAFPQSAVEAVVNARDGKREIELYRFYESGGCDSAGLTRDLTLAMRFGRDRLRAAPTPALKKYDVLFTTADAREIYSYFVEKLDPALVARRLSDYEIGKPIAADIRGDAPTVRALRELPNSSESRAFDGEGAPVRETLMMEKGVPRAFLGGRMFSSYMGIEDGFIPGDVEATGGTATEEEIRRGRYLETVEFSDFQVDPVGGDVFGEIRLAYLHDGEKVTPVTGGSVSGNMGELIKNMRMSRESAVFNNFRIPAATLLSGVTVTGVE